MAQDIFTGIQGNEFGRFTGQSVANQLGIDLEPGSNKGIFKSRVVVIKSARKGNSMFALTNKMADEIQDIILLKEVSEGIFELYKIEFDKVKDKGRPSQSKGKKSGKLTNFKVSEVIKYGNKFDTIKIEIDNLPQQS